MKYIVYRHLSKTSGKSYIGYTKFTMQERLHKHYTNAIYGIDSQFYRAIRKYGIDDFQSEILYTTEDLQEALDQEKHFIEKFNTYKEGYNATLGGTGGNCIEGLSDEKYQVWYNKQIEKSSGVKNPKYSGYSDEDIVSFVKNIIQKNNYVWNTILIKTESKKHGYPMTYSKFRFGGKGKQELKRIISEEFKKEGKKLLPYKKDHKHKQAISRAIKGRHWYTNKKTRKWKQDYPENMNPDEWERGRKK